MKRAKYLDGKRFSQRETERITIDGLDFWQQRIDWNEVFTASTIGRYKAKALDVLRAEKIPLERLLEESPHGSLVLDFVLNHNDSLHDSLPALAAKLLEHALHIEAYQAMQGAMGRVASLAFTFGRLATLFDVYEIENRIQSAKAQKQRSAKSDSGESVLEIIKRLATDGRYAEESAKELWDRFFGELDSAGLCPERNETNQQQRKWTVSYLGKSGTKPMTLGRFSNHVSNSRKEKSR